MSKEGIKPIYGQARKGWLPREGFTADVVQSIVQKTVLNPALTLPLFLLSHYTDKGRGYALDNPKVIKRLKLLLYLGAARWVNGFLNQRALDNWTKDEFDWNKELVVITGGSDGFGKILIHLFAQRNQNTRIINLDIQEPKYSMPSRNIHYINCDLSDPAAITSACDDIKSTYGDPSVVLLNAGIANPYPIATLPDASLQKVFAINTLQHYRLMREFLPAIADGNHGMVVTTASLAAYITPPGLVEYSASKAAALAFHEGLATELIHRYQAPKVRTICLCPGYARTKLAEEFLNQSNFASPTLYPETVAEALFEKILSGSSGHVVVPKIHVWFGQNVRSWPWWIQKGLMEGQKNSLGHFAKRTE